MNPQMTDLRYPIGRFSLEGEATCDRVAAWIDDIAALPADVRRAVSPLTDSQLDTPYRPGGWTVRQVVHHLADSHMNSYIRFKLALTEDRPVIKAYDEKSWAELPDSREPIASSVDLLASLHRRWGGLAAQPELGRSCNGSSCTPIMAPPDWRSLSVFMPGTAGTISRTWSGDFQSPRERRQCARLTGTR